MSLLIKSNVMADVSSLPNVYDFYSSSQLQSEYAARVAADGGQIINATYLANICDYLVTNSLSGKVHTIASASLGIKKDANNNLIKLYNIIGSYDFTVESHGAVTTTPKFTQPESGRPYVAMNNVNTIGGGDVATAFGHFLVQDAQVLAKDSNFAVISVHDLINKTTASTTSLPILSFSDGGLTYNTVLDYSITVIPTDLTASQTSRVRYRDMRNEAGDSESYFGSNEVTGTNFMGKNCVNVVYSTKVERGQIFKSTSAALYSVNKTVWGASQITTQVKSKRKLTWGGSGMLKNTANTKYSNLKLYDLFVLRKVSDVAVMQSFANFVSTQV